MDFANLKSLTIPEGEVAEITCGDVLFWKGGYTNLVPLSTEADGKTIYNGGLGYKNGTRIRSGGAEQGISSACCTGFIPFVKGDKLYIYPNFVGVNTQNAINYYDSAFNCLGQRTDNGSKYGICVNTSTEFATTVVNGVSILDLSNNTVSGVENIAYVRITNLIIDRGLGAIIDSGAEMIITKNEEIEL